ncbi:MAG: OmpH family outer membrane protein [Paracoccaceae bacterium]|nr:OmpH family outer membrane protein [Paracoccaceae bacterium]
MTRLASALVALLFGAWPLAATAQLFDPSPAPVQSPVLVIEFDRFFEESAFGRRAAAERDAEAAVIAAENRRIESELTTEERELTERRAGLEPEEFRALADAFDEKVQRLREEQDTKARAFGARTEEARRRFIAAAQPVLEGLMRDAGAAVILERRTVFVAAEAVDITDLAIERIDTALGDGSDTPPAPEIPPAQEGAPQDP